MTGGGGSGVGPTAAVDRMSAQPATSRMRRATAEDAAEIARLTGELGYAASAEEILHRLRTLTPDASQLVLVMELAPGKLGAWMHAGERLTLESGLRTEIIGLVVDAACRRRKLGATLVAEAERWARQRGAPALAVRSNATRIESHEFYPALGFARSKTQHLYWKVLA